MPDAITLHFVPAIPETTAAMIKGGGAAGRRYRDWPYLLLSYTVVALIAGGGGFIGLALWVFVFDRGDGLLWLLPACVLAAMAIGHLMFRRMIHAQAKMTVRSQFGRLPQTLVFDANGLTQTNDLAEWRTTWRAVEFIHDTKTGLSLTISGIVIPIPNSAFADGHSKSESLEQLQQWHEAAT